MSEAMTGGRQMRHPSKEAIITNEQIMLAILSLGGEMERLIAGSPGPTVVPDVGVLRRELQELRDYIERTKVEVAALKHPKAGEDRLLAATSELDAVVGATEQATNNILQRAEEIESLAERLRDNLKEPLAIEIADQITDATLRLFEHCGFQDITGQRVSKVVNTLRYVEERIASIIRIWGEDSFIAQPLPADVAADTDRHLLNGPQLDGKGISQSEIDSMLGWTE